MNDILLYIAAAIISLCTLAVLVFWLINLKKRKRLQKFYSRVDEASEYFTKLDTIIETSVGSINRKVVSNLKRDSNFLQSDKEEAFNDCRNMVYSMANPEIIEFIKGLGINENAWINARIEYFVRKQKGLK